MLQQQEDIKFFEMLEMNLSLSRFLDLLLLHFTALGFFENLCTWWKGALWKLVNKK